MTNEVRDKLLEMATLLEAPGAWTQGELARDANGNKTAPRGPDAVAWCVSGAVIKTCGDGQLGRDVLRRIRRRYVLVVSWNDHSSTTQEKVVRGLRSLAKEDA